MVCSAPYEDGVQTQLSDVSFVEELGKSCEISHAYCLSTENFVGPKDLKQAREALAKSFTGSWDYHLCPIQGDCATVSILGGLL